MHKVKDEVTRVKDIVGEKNEGSCADIDAQCAQYALHIELFSWWRHKPEVNISPKISISAQPLKMALHRNPAMHGSRMVIFLHDSKKALF